MRLVTVQEMREIERAADAAGLTFAQMMENAGHAVARTIHERLGQRQRRILILAGPGNNGGDGLVAARYLYQWGHTVHVYLWKRPLDDALVQEVQAIGIPLGHYSEDPMLTQLEQSVRESDIIVDALLGTGATGPLRDGAEEILTMVAQVLSGKRILEQPYFAFQPAVDASPLPLPCVVAIDVPSGLDCDHGTIDERALEADLCITMAFPKCGQMMFPGANYIRQLAVADIGIDPSVGAEGPIRVATPEAIRARLPKRPLDSHKGTFGRVLVVAGSINYVGAPALAALGAYRVGAGLVTLGVPAVIQEALAAAQKEATYLLLPHDMGVLTPLAIPILADKIKAYETLLLGPGLGQEEQTLEFIQALFQRNQGLRRTIGFLPHQDEKTPSFDLPPTVIDADGLNLLAKIENWWERLPAKAVLTPHPGEMARLLGVEIAQVNAERLTIARQAAQQWHCTMVLKGAFTVVATPEGKAWVIPFAEPALATAGTGDVLAGAIAGLMAQGLSGPDAALCGAYLHALAGALWHAEHGSGGMLASELGNYLVQAYTSITKGMSKST